MASWNPKTSASAPVGDWQDTLSRISFLIPEPGAAPVPVPPEVLAQVDLENPVFPLEEGLLLDEFGHLVVGRSGGHDYFQFPLRRTNAARNVGGFMIWWNATHADLPHAMVGWREDLVPAELDPERPGWLLRRYPDAVIRFRYDWQKRDFSLAVEVEAEATNPAKKYMVELEAWLPRQACELKSVTATREGEQEVYELPPYGKAKSSYFDLKTPVSAKGGKGEEVTLELLSDGSIPCWYHRGFACKLGAYSPIIRAGEGVRSTKVVFSSKGFGGVSDFSQVREIKGVAEPKLPDIPLPGDKVDQSWLMLHFQYMGADRDLARRWVRLARVLGFSGLAIEWDRALACHPAVPGWAWSWEQKGDLVREIRDQGLEYFSVFNFLGHQSETDILKYRPDWQETHYEALCPSHHEVRDFVRSWLDRYHEVTGESLVHLGGDELEYPSDARPRRQCPLCGTSPNLERVIEYFNEMAAHWKGSGKIMLWADMFLTKGQYAEGVTANNLDGRAAEYLQAMDSSVELVNWQYGQVDPGPTTRFLLDSGHPIALASGQYHHRNPFMLYEGSRGMPITRRIQTTWATPWPLDLPLEAVYLGAMAQAGTPWDPELSNHAVTFARWARSYLESV